jgi:hypothetical protein
VRERDGIIPKRCQWGRVRSRRVVPRRVVRLARPGTVAIGDSGPASTRSMPGSSRCTEAERRASGSTRVRGLAATVDAPRIVTCPPSTSHSIRSSSCSPSGTRCRHHMWTRAMSSSGGVAGDIGSVCQRSASYRGADPAVNLPPRSARPPRGASREWAAGSHRTGRECGYRCILGSCVGSAYMEGQP